MSLVGVQLFFEFSFFIRICRFRILGGGLRRSSGFIGIEASRRVGVQFLQHRFRMIQARFGEEKHLRPQRRDSARVDDQIEFAILGQFVGQFADISQDFVSFDKVLFLESTLFAISELLEFFSQRDIFVLL